MGKPVCLDLFAGTGSSTLAFEDVGWRVVKVELDPKHEADYHYDVGMLSVADLHQMCGCVPDFIWASPPCTAFSVASLLAHWGGGKYAYVPKSKKARDSIVLVQHVRALLEASGCQYWVIENPLGILRKLPILDGIERKTISYCQYGDDRMKPTDLWVSSALAEMWTPRPMCKRGATCHESAPRGSKLGTQGRKGAVDRSRVPYQLGAELLSVLPLDTLSPLA